MFHSENCYWDNINMADIGLCLITFENDILDTYGITYKENINMDSNYSDNPFFMSDKKESEDIVLNFCLLDEFGEPMPWSDEKLAEVCDLFITDTFKPFRSFDNLNYTYFLKATQIVKKLTLKRTGYLEITFKPYSCYVYDVMEYNVRVDGEYKLKIFNNSNVDGLYAPVIKIENLGDELTVNAITNTTTGSQALEITNVNHMETITIDNRYYTVVNQDGDNKFSSCNRKWIGLSKGHNELKITGNCNVSFNVAFPISI